MIGKSPNRTANTPPDIEHLDAVGFDEVWVGEHHSGGYEIIPSPELMLAAAANRTRHIRLGTGVISLPYHNPFMVAHRIAQLDHMTRGRVMFGCGPGQLASDAHMLGIPTDELRPRMQEALGVVIRLLRGETVSHQSWFTLNEARLHLLPYSGDALEMAVTGTASSNGARAAGTFGIGLLSMAERSLRLFAQYVAPTFTGRADAQLRSWEWVDGRADHFAGENAAAIAKAMQSPA